MDLALLPSRIQQTLEPLLSKMIRPQNLGRVISRMPRRLNSVIVQKLLNNVFAEQIREGDFDFLSGRLLQIQIIDAKLYIGISFSRKKIVCDHFSKLPCEADVTLSIDTSSAIQLIQQEVDPDTLFFQRKLKINGDTELAHHVKNTIDTLDPTIMPDFILQLISNYKLHVLN
jgi:predicted lipid carrier protein YhbT